MTRRFTRRELAAMLGVGALVGSTARVSAGPQRPGVVGSVDLDPKRFDRNAARSAVEGAARAATGVAEGKNPLAGVFGPSDTVGIKLNCLAGPRLSPRLELVEALVELIVGVGVSRSRIIVFERSSRELERAGYQIRRSGGPYLCYGTDNKWDRRPSDSGAIGSCFAREVSTTCTALVSFGVVKDHDLAGVSAGMKNWYGVIHNPNKYHDNNCDPYVADVMNHPFLADKHRLTVLDGVQAQCHGGPAFVASGLFTLGKVAVSTDPVAADLWAWRVLDAERVRRGMPSLEAAGRPPKWIATAASYGLGVGDPEKLREVRG